MKRRIVPGLAALLALTACQQKWVYEAERNQRIMATNPPRATYDVPPQVIYRIDDHRFITLENYNHCAGNTWYNETKQGVRTNVGVTWPAGFKGKLIIDDPTGMNVAIPKVSTNLCGDRGCMNYVGYSTGGGRTFAWVQYDRNNISFESVESSMLYAFIVLSDRMYVLKRERYSNDTYVTQYPLVSGIDLNKPYPEWIRGDSFRASNRPGFLSGFRTPSGDDHYVCVTPPYRTSR